MKIWRKANILSAHGVKWRIDRYGRLMAYYGYTWNGDYFEELEDITDWNYRQIYDFLGYDIID